jgi:hypothetical protein
MTKKVIAYADTKADALKHPLRVPRTRVIAVKPCDGSAHSNPHVDNCMLCAPRWGWVVAALALFVGGCSALSDFDRFRFDEVAIVDASDAATLADVGALDVDASDGSIVVVVDAGADVGALDVDASDGATFNPNAPDCCGLGCSMCPGPDNARRCRFGDIWICAVSCGCEVSR